MSLRNGVHHRTGGYEQENIFSTIKNRGRVKGRQA